MALHQFFHVWIDFKTKKEILTAICRKLSFEKCSKSSCLLRETNTVQKMKFFVIIFFKNSNKVCVTLRSQYSFLVQPDVELTADILVKKLKSKIVWF